MADVVLVAGYVKLYRLLEAQLSFETTVQVVDQQPGSVDAHVLDDYAVSLTCKSEHTCVNRQVTLRSSDKVHIGLMGVASVTGYAQLRCLLWTPAGVAKRHTYSSPPRKLC